MAKVVYKRNNKAEKSQDLTTIKGTSVN